MSLCFLDVILLADVAVCSISQAIYHFIVLVTIVTFNPMETNTSNTGRTLLVQFVEIRILLWLVRLGEHQDTILTIGIDVYVCTIRASIYGTNDRQ